MSNILKTLEALKKLSERMDSVVQPRLGGTDHLVAKKEAFEQRPNAPGVTVACAHCDEGNNVKISSHMVEILSREGGRVLPFLCKKCRYPNELYMQDGDMYVRLYRVYHV